ncbi:MAG: hypothetical protein Q8916_07955 [Bacteroidota bacterium]|nr:hypothetical protein [Bacteroidota bacterium]MDP4230319.1 hypothetical protein [Bacteroidota bacterium]MDP4235686.1 hypothetical protein [Bacteroidota bacterium]
MTLAALILAFQMMFGTTPTDAQLSDYQTQLSQTSTTTGIIVVTDSQEGF